MRWLIPALTLLLASCAVSVTTYRTPAGAPLPAARPAPAPITPEQFTDVVRAVRTAATQECRQRTQDINCTFLVVIDPDRRAPPNAYQSIDDQGRPVLTFTAPLIANMRNPDELAFILGHEAAHHVAGHLARQQQNAARAAVVFANLADLTGGSRADIADAQRLGAAVGARAYSREFELEADELGTIITHRAGYDPLTGAQFFARIPDPGDQFLGTHPPNAARLEVVRRTGAWLGLPG